LVFYGAWNLIFGICSSAIALEKLIVDVYNQDKLLTRAVCAGVHNPQFLNAAKAGAYVVVIPYIVFLQMVYHPLTYMGIKPVSQWLENDSAY
jgi:hypothetical protein